MRFDTDYRQSVFADRNIDSAAVITARNRPRIRYRLSTSYRVGKAVKIEIYYRGTNNDSGIAR